jgi:hypothetical protein
MSSVHQELQILPLCSPADKQSAGVDLDSINMGLLHKVKILIMLGAVTGDNPIILVYAGATVGTKTTELPFKFRKSGADTLTTGSDVFGAATSQAADGVGAALGTAATIDERVYTIDFLSESMPAGMPFLTVFVDDGSASVLLISAIGIGWPRFEGPTHVTVL